MAFVEGIGDDVTVTVLVLTVGLGIFIVMYLRLVQSAQRNSTLHNTGSPSEYEPVNQQQTHDHGQHNQINETNLTQVEHEVSERIPDNSGPAQSNSAESSSANTTCAVDNTEDERHECAPNSDHNEQSQTNTESVDQSDSPPDHERTFTPTPQSGSFVPPPQSTEDTTRNRFHSSHTEPNDQETTNEDVICVRVKYNEINRDVQVSKRITVLEFKRQCFPHEMQEGKLVRLIYSGHLLHSDHRVIKRLWNCTSFCYSLSDLRHNTSTTTTRD